jgi:hypothetical protein
MENKIMKKPASLSLLDKDYLSAINDIPRTLEVCYNNIIAEYDFDLSKFEITETVLNRLKHHYQTQALIKSLLDKHKMKDGADFFVETVLFFLKAYLEKLNPDIKIYSEIAIVRRKGAIRPDISIWNGGELIAIIECKTQLGYSRNSWKEEFLLRKTVLESTHPNAKFLLLVMTGNNWRGFQGHELIGFNLFCLLKDVWPTNYDSLEQVDTPLENLFETVQKLVLDSFII